MATVQEMMQEPVLVLAPENTVEQAIAAIRAIPRERQYTYPMVADKKGRLVGLVVMRDLILADAKAKISTVMMTKIFSLQQGLGIHDALKRIKGMEIPEYPIIARNGKLRGVVRAARLHEIEEARLTATPGRMVGVAEGETVATPFLASVKSRLPWLMINLVTAFAAGLVVGNFQDTIDRVVLLAAFLPVLAGQSGNTGAQALAITLRTLERTGGTDFYSAALWKEIRLGIVHGIITGILVGAVIYIVAMMQGDKGPEFLALIVFFATILSVLVSGLCGASVPVVLKRCGADPATASSIILTTATDIVSMGSMLTLATMLIAYLT